MRLERVPGVFSICKLTDFSAVDLSRPFCFAARTDRECSLVCPTEFAPEAAIERDDGWRAFRVAGQLDFSLIGILSRISGILAEAGIGIFAVSTFDTDYILTRAENYERALSALRCGGLEVD